MKDEQFRSVFFAAQERLRNMTVAFIEIDNDLELYLFEVYAAMKLDTDTWNTFRTHLGKCTARNWLVGQFRENWIEAGRER